MTHEILTPTEKLKALRETAKFLTDALGKVVTYDDETTQAIMSEAETHAVTLLQTIHDGNKEDITNAIADHAHEAPVMRFEHSIDCLQAREQQLSEAYHALLNLPCKNTMSNAAYEIIHAEAEHLGRQIEDIRDTINNLYAIREVC